MGYFVSGPQAVVIIGGHRRYLSHGAVIPDGVDADRLAHLLDVGLVEKDPDVPEPEVVETEVDPDRREVEPEPDLDGLTVDQLRDLAAERGVDLQGATRKDDIKAALTRR